MENSQIFGVRNKLKLANRPSGAVSSQESAAEKVKAIHVLFAITVEKSHALDQLLEKRKLYRKVPKEYESEPWRPSCGTPYLSGDRRISHVLGQARSESREIEPKLRNRKIEGQHAD